VHFCDSASAGFIHRCLVRAWHRITPI